MPKIAIIGIGIVLLILVFLFFTVLTPVKIGVLISLDSSLGNEEVMALHYYLRNHSHIGFTPVELIIENPQLAEDSIEEAFNALLDQEVSIIIGASLSYSGEIAARLADKHNIAFISPTTSTLSLSGKKDNFYRLMMSNYEQGIHPANYLNSLDMQSAVLLLSKQNRAYSEPLADAFIEGFNGDAIKVFNDPAKPDPDILLQIKPDIVFFILPAEETIHYLKSLKEHLPETKVMSSAWGYQQLQSVFSGEILDGLVVVTPSGPERHEPYKAMMMEFANLYRLNPTFVADLSIASIELAYSAIEKAGKSRPRIIEELNKPQIVNWAFGELYMDSYGDVIQDYYYMYELKDDSFELLQKFRIDVFFDAVAQ